MKKFFKLLAVSGMLTLALTGCGKDKTQPTPTPAPDTSQKQGMVTDDGTKGTLVGVFNKTYTIGKEGNAVYGTLFMGNPTLTHKTDNGGKAYIEVMIPLKLTNSAKTAVEPKDLLNGLTIDGNYNPYQDQLKLMCIETKAIVKGNTDKDDQYYFVGLFDKGLKMQDNKPVLEAGQSAESYFRYIVTTDDIHMDQLKNMNFNDLTLNDFEFIINAKDGNGYTIVK